MQPLTTVPFEDDTNSYWVLAKLIGLLNKYDAKVECSTSLVTIESLTPEESHGEGYHFVVRGISGSTG